MIENVIDRDQLGIRAFVQNTKYRPADPSKTIDRNSHRSPPVRPSLLYRRTTSSTRQACPKLSYQASALMILLPALIVARESKSKDCRQPIKIGRASCRERV